MRKILIIFILLIVLSLVANLLITRAAMQARHHVPAGTPASPYLTRLLDLIQR